MNKIVKNAMNNYVVIDNEGNESLCKLWFEKKTSAWHVVLPKDHVSGRTYIRQAIVDEAINLNGEYTFGDKLEHRTGLATGGWKAKLTDEEKAELAEAEATIERIKAAAMARKVEKPEKGSVEDLEAQLEKLQAKLAEAKAKRG